MQFYKYFVVSFVILAIWSCSEADEISPTLLYGTWEQSNFLEGRDMDLVGRYNFYPDGSFERIHFFRKPESAEIIGYTQYLKGEMEIAGRQVKFINGVFHSLADEQKEYGDLVDFQEVDDIRYNAEAVLEFEKNNREVVMDFGPCNPILSSICIRHQRYTKIIE